MKILDKDGLAYFWTKLKGFFAPISHTHTSYAVKHSYTTAANAAKNWYRIANANTSQTDTTKPIHAQFILTAYNTSYDAGYYERWFVNAEVFGRNAHIVILGNTSAPFSQARILYENTVADLDANDRPAIDIYLNYALANGTTKIEIEEVYNQGWTFVANGQISASTIPTGFESVACDGVRNNGVLRSTYCDWASYTSLQRSNFSANFTLADNNTYRARVLNCTGTITVTVPSLNSVNSWFIIKNFNTTSGVITIHPSTTSVLIDGSNADIKLQPGEYVMIHSKAANAYTMIMDGRWKSQKADKGTTLSDYGITDAKIANGTITLGSNSITPLTSVPSHNQASNTITAMTGYSKPSSGSAIATSDSLNSAIGKLEAKVDAYDDSNYVHKTGNETVAGVKNFTNATISPIFVVSNPNFTKGTLPSDVIYDSVYFGDKNARGDFKDCIGSVESALNPTTNVVSTWIKVRKNVPRESSSSLEDSLLGIHYDGNTSEFYATAPSTLTTRDSDYDILTRDWIPKDTRVVHTSGTESIGGSKTFTSIVFLDEINRTTSNSHLILRGGADYTSSVLQLHGGGSSADPGCFKLHARTSLSNNKILLGKPDGTLSWNGQSIQVSSDERVKTPLASVPDEVLDAWGDVGWGQFQYLEAIDKKGASARLHLGLIAQRVKATFEARGLDALSYGILCHDEEQGHWHDLDNNEEWPAMERRWEVDTPDLWTVRYAEAFAMEAACQRRENARLKKRIADLEERLAALELKVS